MILSIAAPADSPRTLFTDERVRIPTRLFSASSQAVQHIVLMIENLIRERRSAGQPCVLGLPTGSTPVSVYRELVRLHREEGLDFSGVITFNLDEYYPMPREEQQSYWRFMHENLFSHVNIKPENIHLPDGTGSVEQIESRCIDFEQAIKRAGGIDLMLLGIGRTGHIGFNEPGASPLSRTRLVRLDPVSRRDNAGSFHGEEYVPTHAVTMGIATILECRKIVLMAFGEHKSAIVCKALEEPANEACPASFLQNHPQAVFVIDEPAASELSAIRTPWVTGMVDWNPELIRRAVLWLSVQAGKGLLKLTSDDFRAHNLHELLREHGPATKLCKQIFRDRLETICEHPGGDKPTRVLCFSPHPDDDVISMGGTLIRLQEDGHDVHVAYMTTGNVAVHDHEAIRFANFVSEFNQTFGLAVDKTSELEAKIQKFLSAKHAGQTDSDEVLAIKTLVRKTEAIAATQAIYIGKENLHFLDLPFYRTGQVRKRPLSEADIEIVLRLLETLRPTQIYVAGDLADPHGTHRTCALAAFEAVRRYRESGGELEVWLYRGAWQEYEPHQIERAVPLTPYDILRKRMAIFRHQSQKDGAMFMGSTDKREFWQRAEDRNRQTASLYDKLGLPEYFAMEGFVLWKGEPIA
jgi:glucosamine-6-phosphate deaminase